MTTKASAPTINAGMMMQWRRRSLRLRLPAPRSFRTLRILDGGRWRYWLAGEAGSSVWHPRRHQEMTLKLSHSRHLCRGGDMKVNLKTAIAGITFSALLDPAGSALNSTALRGGRHVCISTYQSIRTGCRSP